MRVPRILVESPIADTGEYFLSGRPLQHISKVLRLRAGAEVVLFDGRGGEWDAKLEEIRRDHARLALLRFREVNREPPIRWELVQGISRGERMDYTLQKSVELGVAAIHPVEMKRTVVRLDDERARKRVEHWQGVVTGACEQSGRTLQPVVHGVQSLQSFFAEEPKGTILLLDPEARHSIAELPTERPERVLLVAGPEGGFEDHERALIKQSGGVGVRMGPRILRTETAAVVAAALMLSRWGDL